MLRLNFFALRRIGCLPYSNTTNVKVKLEKGKSIGFILANSNTTNVKVKPEEYKKIDEDMQNSNTTNVKVKHKL